MNGRTSNGDATRTQRVAFQGERGAFSEEAVTACFGPDAQSVPFRENLDAARNSMRRHHTIRQVLHTMLLQPAT